MKVIHIFSIFLKFFFQKKRIRQNDAASKKRIPSAKYIYKAKNKLLKYEFSYKFNNIYTPEIFILIADDLNGIHPKDFFPRQRNNVLNCFLRVMYSSETNCTVCECNSNSFELPLTRLFISNLVRKYGIEVFSPDFLSLIQDYYQEYAVK